MRHATTTLFFAAALGAALTLPAPPAAAAEAVSACGTTVTRDAYLDADLGCTGDIAITVSGDAILDLRGHTLSGAGVALVGGGRAEVRNGSITGARVAITAGRSFSGAAGTAVVTAMKVTDSGLPLTSQGDFENPSLRPDILVNRSTFARNEHAVRIAYARAHFSTTHFLGDSPIGLECFDATCELTKTVMSGHALGIRQFGGTLAITSSRLLDNGTAYHVAGGGEHGFSTGVGQVRNSVFADNDRAVVSWAYAQIDVRDSAFLRNRSGYSTPAGRDGYVDALVGNTFVGNHDAIVTDTEEVRLGANRAIANTGWGIHAPGATDLGDNAAYGNGNAPQCVGVAC